MIYCPIDMIPSPKTTKQIRYENLCRDRIAKIVYFSIAKAEKELVDHKNHIK